jgi:transcriptional regulator with XRE-family HTH domain
MRRKNILIRVFRALSGMTQKDFALATGLHPVLVAKYEQDLAEPGAEHLERAAQGAGLTTAAGEQILDRVEVRQKLRQRAGQGLGGLADEIESLISDMEQRLLSVPLPESRPDLEDRAVVDRLWKILEGLDEEGQLVVVRIAPDFQVRPLAERVREESALLASSDPERAASLARLASEIADRAR